MFEDVSNFCLIAMFIIAGLILLPRLLNMLSKPDYSQRGDERPRHDDPNIGSSGGFGGHEQPRHDDPDIGSRGSFGSSGGQRRFSLPSWSRRNSGGEQANSPNIRSRGGFGRSKN